MAYTSSFHKVLESGDYTFKLIPATITEIDHTDSPYTATIGETLYVDASAGSVTVNLPEADAAGHRVRVHVTDHANGVSVARAGSDTIMGASSFEVTDINSVDYEFITIGSGPYDWKFTEAMTRGDVEAYADTAESDAISSANSYTDGKITNDPADIVSDVETKAVTAHAVHDYTEDVILPTANGYTDSAVSGLATTSYVDTAESDANSYTDTAMEDAPTTPYKGFLSVTSSDSPISPDIGSIIDFDDAGTGGITIYIPDYASATEGDRILVFIRRNGGTVTISAGGTDYVGGTTSYTNTGQGLKLELIAKSLPVHNGWMVVSSSMAY